MEKRTWQANWQADIWTVIGSSTKLFETLKIKSEKDLNWVN